MDNFAHFSIHIETNSVLDYYIHNFLLRIQHGLLISLGGPFVYTVANKTIGRDYLLGKEDGVPHGYYYFARYWECKHCSRKTSIYLNEYEAQEFIHYATPRLDRRSFWKKLISKIPHFKIVVEKGKEERELERKYSN